MRLFLFFISLVAFPALSAWQLDNDKSSLSFISIKNGNVAEVHHFNQLSGTFDESGKVSFSIDLLSVDTNVVVRDERMRKFLFNTDVFPKANFDAQVDMEKFNNIAVGSADMIELTGDISLHGRVHTAAVKVVIAKLSNESFVVSSLKPILLYANNFALEEGVNKLKELAKLPSISNAVPVSFIVSFNKETAAKETKLK